MQSRVLSVCKSGFVVWLGPPGAFPHKVTRLRNSGFRSLSLGTFASYASHPQPHRPALALPSNRCKTHHHFIILCAGSHPVLVSIHPRLHARLPRVTIFPLVSYFFPASRSSRVAPGLKPRFSPILRFLALERGRRGGGVVGGTRLFENKSGKELYDGPSLGSYVCACVRWVRDRRARCRYGGSADGFGWTRSVVVMFSRQLCSNPHCKRTSPGDGPTCRWHVRNYGSQKDPKHVTLCNACKINFDQGKYCPFCVQIYREKDPDSFDGKEWVGCDNRTCRRWVHVECEINGGNPVDSTAYYLCPSCRENAQELGEKKRCGRLPVQEQVVVASTQSYVDNSSSEGLEQKPKMPLSLRSTRRPLQVDLSKLEASSLKRYRRVYNLREVASSCKEELVPAVAQHFAAQVVEENETLLSFAFFLKKQQSFATSSMTQHQVAHPVAK